MAMVLLLPNHIFLFSSIFRIFDEINFVCFLPSMIKSNKTFSFVLLAINISVSKASLVLTQLKPLINVFPNNHTWWALVGSTIQHLLLSLCTQPLNELAELQLWGLYVKVSCKRPQHCSNISHTIIVSWKL